MTLYLCTATVTISSKGPPNFRFERQLKYLFKERPSAGVQYRECNTHRQADRQTDRRVGVYLSDVTVNTPHTRTQYTSLSSYIGQLMIADPFGRLPRHIDLRYDKSRRWAL